MFTIATFLVGSVVGFMLGRKLSSVVIEKVKDEIAKFEASPSAELKVLLEKIKSVL
jgi:uncharacterized membrane protein